MTVRRGSLHLGQAEYARHFDGLQAVVLLRDGPDLLVLPVRHAAAGGYVLKLRNSAGDRVVAAADFFRANGLGDEERRELTARWDEQRAALRAVSAFA
jgi:hypothetical protein